MEQIIPAWLHCVKIVDIDPDVKLNGRFHIQD